MTKRRKMASMGDLLAGSDPSDTRPRKLPPLPLPRVVNDVPRAALTPGPIVVLEAWHSYVCDVERMGEDAEAMHVAWTAAAEAQMTNLEIEEWDRKCFDYTFGKPTDADIRRNALEVLR